MGEETDTQAVILKYLKHCGIKSWRNNNTAIYDVKKGRFRKFTGLPGVSDILGMYIGANMLAIECKTHDEYKYIQRNYNKLKTSIFKPNQKKQIRVQNQIHFLEDVNKKGGTGIFASRLEHVTIALKLRKDGHFIKPMLK